jgi:anti-sigma-K factor RskA
VNIQEYISSGIIQAYVLGLASEEERREFEKLAAIHPELQQAREAFEISLEQHAMDNGVKPPQQVKDRFLEAIRESSRSKPSLNPSKIITMENEKVPLRRAGGSRYAAAAAIIIAIGLGWFAYSSHQQNEQLRVANEELKHKSDSAENLLNQVAIEKDALKKSTINVVKMEGTHPSASKSSANVFWDSTSQSVYMVVKNMPRLPNDKQYQLWALIDGKPKDLGVFDINDEKFIIKMNNTQKADAFAISIEQKGGSPTPHMDQIQSMGKLKAQ